VVDDISEAALDALMARLAEGDRAAFDPLFDALHPRALRLARARLDPAAAADAAQATLYKLFAYAPRFQPGRPVLPWFYAIAANEVRALMHARHAAAARHVPVEDAERLAGDDDPERGLLAQQLRRALDEAVARLDTASVAAIEAVLGEGTRPSVTPATFRKRVSRAYAQLRTLLGGAYGF
jgi:RNA polymerase sigma-70 factor (ECF subfamily)